MKRQIKIGAYDKHLLDKLKKAFETKRNEDKHHEAFRWNKIKHVNVIARKINFQKIKKILFKKKKKTFKTYDELRKIWSDWSTYKRLDGTEMDTEKERTDYFRNVLLPKFKKDIENLDDDELEEELLSPQNWT